MHRAKTYFIHFLLFIVTFFTTTLAGTEWIHAKMVFELSEGRIFGEWLTWDAFSRGFAFSVPFLLFLTCHEFGHYITARLYRVHVSLPYYIPLWLGVIFTFGTMGAFIQIKEPLKSRKEFFDIGIAGPLAGFVVAVGILYYGFTHLPPSEYVFEIHPEYKTEFPKEYEKYGSEYARYAYKYPDTEENRKAGVAGKEIEGSVGVGRSLLFLFFENFVVEDKTKIPHSYEMMHYPYVFAGFLALLFTALNLIPIGQLDGGHILYGLLGYENHRRIAPVLFVVFVLYAGLGIFAPLLENLDQLNTLKGLATYILPYVLYFLLLFIIFSKTFRERRQVLQLVTCIYLLQFLLCLLLPSLTGYSGWMLFALLLGRVLGVYHPPAYDDRPLSTGRKVLGWVALVIFVISFSPQPLVI